MDIQGADARQICIDVVPHPTIDQPGQWAIIMDLTWEGGTRTLSVFPSRSEAIGNASRLATPNPGKYILRIAPEATR